MGGREREWEDVMKGIELRRQLDIRERKNNTDSEGETEKGREEEVNDLKAGLLNEVDMREKKEVKKLIH